MSVAGGASQERARAARILAQIVYSGKTTDQTIGQDASPLLRELVYGTLRYYFLLQPLIDEHLGRSLKSRDLDLRCLLLVGAYQLHYLRTPDHAAVNETVSACRSLKKPWARALVNAVLRKVARSATPDPAEHSFGLPLALAQALRTAFPEDADAVMAATLDRAPMALRVNARRLAPEQYARTLVAAGIDAQPGWLPESLILTEPRPVRELPGHAEGQVSVQDSGAMFAAGLVEQATRGSSAPRILDACAAPGGKLFHLAERLPQATLIGLERHPERHAHLRSEAARLGHEGVTLLQADATGRGWHDGRPYDAILLDAPCSGSGTLRRHPDIKVRQQSPDLVAFADLQRTLLANLLELLAPRGELLYCTCSLFPAENDAVIEAFLASRADAQPRPLTLPVGRPTRFGWQLVPLPNPGELPNRTVDGFYYARLTRSG